MIGHIAFGVRTARANARVHAFLIDAGLCMRTVAIHRAFGAAFDVRVAEVVGQTRTRSGIIADFANGIGAAR